MTVNVWTIWFFCQSCVSIHIDLQETVYSWWQWGAVTILHSSTNSDTEFFFKWCFSRFAYNRCAYIFMKVFLFDATLKVYQVDAIQLSFASLSQNLFCGSTNFFAWVLRNLKGQLKGSFHSNFVNYNSFKFT